jgi:RNA polymerase sigma-70 factor (ECF subfamily)
MGRGLARAAGRGWITRVCGASSAESTGQSLDAAVEQVVIETIQSRRASVYDHPSRDCDRGDERVAEAFEELFQAYEQKIFGVVYRMVGDHEDAADLTAETFARALRGYHRFRGDAQPYTWLYRIALNLCKNYFRQQQHRSRVHSFSLDSLTEVDGEFIAREIEDPTQSPQSQVEARELEDRVAKCLAALRPELRTLIVLRDIQGLSYQEIGRVLGCSEKAVKSRLFRARMQLRDALSQHLPRP